MEFIRKGRWRYCVTLCDTCDKTFDVRIDIWNKLQKEDRLFRCRTCTTSLKAFVHGYSINASNKQSDKNWLYKRWQLMKKRCSSSESYKRRNITVCTEWNSDFLAFKTWAEQNGAMQHLELDRKNNDLGYCPENCRWVTHKENCRQGGRSGKFRINKE